MTARAYGLFENQANTRLIAKLRQQNRDTLLFPEPVCEAIDAVIPPLAEFDWLIFPDLRSVEYFVARLGPGFVLDDLRVCAMGEAISDQLRFSRIHADVIPPRVEAQAVFDAISAYQSPSGERFLIPSELDANLPVVALLNEGGALTTTLPVYRAHEPPGIARLRMLLKNGAVDEFIFTSPQDVFSFMRFIGSDAGEFAFSASDVITLQTLRDFGLTPTRFK